MIHDPLAAALALWLDHRLPPSAGSADDDARLFGLTVLDVDEVLASAAESPRVDGAVRFVAVAEGEAYRLAGDVAPLAIVHYEALALVTHGWAAPLGGAASGIAPSEHPDRRRVRVTTVAVDSGALGSVVRRTAPSGVRCDEPPLRPGPVTGPLAELFGRSCTIRSRPIIGRWDHPPAA